MSRADERGDERGGLSRDGALPAPIELDSLSDRQIDAASHAHGPLVVFAGAGSGKTRVITYRIANLLATLRVPPYRILAVTFTNKAAGEMKRRLEHLVGEELTRDLWVGTFHSVCAKLLRRYHDAVGLTRSFVIYDDVDQRAVMNRIYKELGIDDRRHPQRAVLGRIHREKQEGVGAADFVPQNFLDETVARCFSAYEERFRLANAVDFDDLLLHMLRLVEAKDERSAAGAAGAELRRRFSHVLVDEFQDVNQVQYRIVKALSAERRNLAVVGDDDQSIYRWRGADVRILRSFRRDFADAQIVKLEQNYRSTNHIVQAALGVIKPSTEREPKELFTENSDGDPVRIVAAQSERDEAAWVAERIQEAIDQGTNPAEIAVFYRVHAQSRVLEEVMRAERIPHQILGGLRFFERAEIKDLLSYLRVIDNPASDVDLARIINVPSRKIGAQTINQLTELANAEKLSLSNAVEPLIQSGRVGAAAKKALTGFSKVMERLRKVSGTAGPSELAQAVLEESGYAAMLAADDSTEAEGRAQNLSELIGAIREYEEEAHSAGEEASLSGYLERVTLTAVADELKDQPRVVLMTIHAAKGLEFEQVFITGMEEDLFPFRSQDPNRDWDVEEERRLAYVAITRARQKLFITHTERRMIFGTTRYGAPSRFLQNLPPDVVLHMKTRAAERPIERFIDRPSPGLTPRLSWSSQARKQVAPPPAREEGSRFVEFDHDSGEGLRVGAPVLHTTFGVGRVRRVESGADPTYTVEFSGWGQKRIKARFLSPVEA